MTPSLWPSPRSAGIVPYIPGGAHMARATTPVRLGVIDYLNVLPVYDALLRRERAGSLGGVVTHAGTPAQMNRALADGTVDLSNVSSVSFGEHATAWRLIPELAVAARREVRSVVLFSRSGDWRALDGGSIALSSASATSVALVRLLAERRYGIHARYVTCAPDLAAMLAEHDAALLIGDGALREYALRRPLPGLGYPFAFDLAEEWHAWTGLPFVFSVFAVRADRAETVAASGVVALLRASARAGLAALDPIAAEAAARLGLPVAVCAAYLRVLRYALGERELAGLRAFLELAVPGFRWSAVRLLGQPDDAPAEPLALSGNGASR